LGTLEIGESTAPSSADPEKREEERREEAVRRPKLFEFEADGFTVGAAILKAMQSLQRHTILYAVSPRTPRNY